MKTISLISAASLLLTTSGGFAQSSSEKTDQPTYRIKIVKEEIGKKEVTDKTFASKEELVAYAKENNIETPEAGTTILKTVKRTEGKQKMREEQPNKNYIKKEKKIIIIEKDESSLGEKTDFEITLSNLTDKESGELVQEIINKKIGTLAVVNTATKSEAQNTPAEGTNVGINDKPNNLNSLKVYPNPSNSEFHVEFSVTKPCNVKLRINDMQGKEVYAEAMNNYSGKFEKNITRSDLSSGTYLMVIEAGNEKETTTVVMQ